MATPCTRPIRSVSVLMPTWQGMEFLERVLDALAAQRTSLPWDVHVVDSGSTDGTWELFQARRDGFPVPLHLRRIESAEFDHGDTRNVLSMLSRADLLIHLTQDAIPSRPDWIETLARNFEDPLVGAAYCRNVPRHDAKLLTRVFCRDDPNYSPERVEERLPDAATLAAMSVDERRFLYNFNDVASAVRRELWERHPFPRTTMGEDVLIGRGILDAGYTVVFDAEATVDHSHDYGPEKMRWRGRVDGKFNVEWMERVCVASESDMDVLLERLLEGDARELRRRDVAPDELEPLLAEARELRAAQLRGLYEGGLSRWRYPGSAMRASGDLRALFVLRGYPPEDAGGDVGARTRALARALVARGHAVTVVALSGRGANGRLHVAREDAGAGEPTVLRVRVPDEVGALEAAFQGVLACERPDVVHFRTPDGACAGLLRLAREARVATVADLLDERLLDPAHTAAFEEVARADLRIVHDPALRAAFLEATELDPQLLAYVRRGELAPGPDDKPLEEEAAELEFRYRALACIVRDERAARQSLDARGTDARTTGRAESQGTGWLLLHAGAAAEYTLGALPEGPATLEVEQHALASEADVVLGGTVLIDGAPVGVLAPTPAPERDHPFRQRLMLDLPRGARFLRLEPGIEDSGLGLKLRLRRVTLRPRAAGPSADAPVLPPPPADIAALVEELRVAPGPPVDVRDLPRVAVVVPNLDGRGTLRECLASIAAFHYDAERVEVLLVDNASRDGSVDWVRRNHPRVRVVQHERNRGFAASCNAGARAAPDAGVLVFVNNDMWFQEGFLHELVSPLVRRECAATTAKLLGTDGAAIDTSGTGTTFLGIAVQPGYGRAPEGWSDVPRRTLFGCGGAMAIDAGVFEDVGGFDEEYFAYYEDLDLGWRMWLMGHEVHYVPAAVGYHHHSHTSRRFPEEAVRLVMIRNSLYTCVKNYDHANLARVLPALLALAIRRARLKSGLDERPFRIEDARPRGRLAQTLRKRLGGLLKDRRRTVPIERMGAADLIAIDDLLRDWEHWMERRREVQARRKREDAEIQRLFLEPLACVEGDPGYAALQSGLVRMFGLDEVFRRA